MDLLLNLTDWDIPWAGLGAVLLGLGSTLSGIAAVMSARALVHRPGEEGDGHNSEDGDSSGLRVVDGSGERSSSSARDSGGGINPD